MIRMSDDLGTTVNAPWLTHANRKYRAVFWLDCIQHCRWWPFPISVKLCLLEHDLYKAQFEGTERTDT